MTRELLLANRAAVVTGAGRGLGQAVALALAAHGAAVTAVARTGPQVDDTVSQIHAAGGRAIGMAVDVSNPAAVERLRDKARCEFGTVAILVNAAGIFGPIQPIAEGDAAQWIETLQINTIGPYLTCRAFVPDMLAAGWGRIINFSSAASLHAPGPLNSAYGTSKVALNQFTRHLAAELSGTNVTANVIHPGEVKTHMWADVQAASQATGRIGEGYRRWAADVEATGGDPPQKAVELVLKIIQQTDARWSGKFLWIEGGQQAPIPSW